MADGKPTPVRHANTVAVLVMLGYVQVGAARVNGHYVGFFEPHPALSDVVRRYNEIFKDVQGMVSKRQSQEGFRSV